MDSPGVIAGLDPAIPIIWHGHASIRDGHDHSMVVALLLVHGLPIAVDGEADDLGRRFAGETEPIEREAGARVIDA
jgi:hypothetical protein